MTDLLKKKLLKLKELFPQKRDLELLEAICKNTNSRKYRKNIIKNINNISLQNYIDSRGQTKQEKNRKEFEGKSEEEIDFIESIEEITADLTRNYIFVRKSFDKKVFNEINNNSLFNYKNYQKNLIESNGEEKKSNRLLEQAKSMRLEGNKLKDNTYNLLSTSGNSKAPPYLVAQALFEKIDENNLKIKEIDKQIIKSLIKNNELRNQESKQKNILIIDLHIFHEKEALDYAKDILNSIKIMLKKIENKKEHEKKQILRYRKIEFITGRADKSFKIRPALVKLLEENKFNHFENGPKILVNLF